VHGRPSPPPISGYSFVIAASQQDDLLVVQRRRDHAAEQGRDAGQDRRATVHEGLLRRLVGQLGPSPTMASSFEEK
jgi:hypothetical protein